MLTPRIFVDAAEGALVVGVRHALTGTAARHVAHALRMRAGDRVALFNGTGGEYETTIEHIDRATVDVRIERHVDVERETSWPVTLVQAVISADMMDFVIRKAVELGVGAIAPFNAARSQRVGEDRAGRRLLHWRQIAIAACEQCGRNRVPRVLALADLEECLSHAHGSPLAILDADARASLSEIARTATPRTIVVGPEGGLAPEEVRRAQDRGALTAHLGGRVLRAETAAVAALATINAIAGDAR
jgi:16S rRNA (uracil1498-N3)-methyltransferase